jgi:hypothetical protein
MKKLTSFVLLTSLFLMLIPVIVTPGVTARGKPVYDACTLVSPNDGAVVSGSVTIEVITTNGITPEIYIDGVLVATAYTYTWDTTGVTDGDHEVKAQTDRKNKDVHTVTVDNGGTPPPPPPGDGDKYAVIVGVSNYIDPAVGDLSYCDDDARDWKIYLESQGWTIVACLIDRKATEPAVEAAIADMLALIDSPDDKIAFISSGHGAKVDNDHVLLYADCYAPNTDGDGYVGGVVPDYEFESWWADVTNPLFIFLDHCNSGGMNEVMHSNIYMTTTCTGDGYGYDVPAFRNGAWTYYFLEAGLVGQGFTTAEECYDWASANYPYGGADSPCEYDQITGSFTF